MQAFRFSRSSAQFEWWWNWWPSWIVAGGPVGRYAGGAALAWRELDRADGGGLLRLSNGVFIALGLMLSLITIVSYVSVNRTTMSGDADGSRDWHIRPSRSSEPDI